MEKNEGVQYYTVVQPNEAPARKDAVYVDHIIGLKNKKSAKGENFPITAENLLGEYEALQKFIFDKGDGAAAKAVGYIPKAKLYWVNRVVKDAVNTQYYSPCDLGLLNKIWMHPDHKENLIQFIKKNAKASNQNKIHGDFPSKGKFNLQCVEGNLRPWQPNPGFFDPITGRYQHFPSQKDMEEYIGQLNGMQGPAYMGAIPSGFSCKTSNSQKLDGSSECGCSDETLIDRGAKIYNLIDMLKQQSEDLLEIAEQTRSMDKLKSTEGVIGLLQEAREKLFDRHISQKDLEGLADAFSYMRDISRSKYLLSVTDPFMHRSAKIPNNMPVPSASFSLRSNVNLTTNASGNVAFAYQPFALSASGAATSTLGVNNNAALSGSVASNFFLSTDIGMNLPANFYSKYRLVSAGVRVTFTASQLNSSGYGSIGATYSNAGAPVAVGTAISPYQNYGIFNNVENSYFKQTKPLRSDDRLEINFMPLDESYWDFFDLGTVKDGFIIVGYITGAPANATVARLDIVVNYEAMVDLAYTDYLPCNIYTGNIADLRIVQRTASELQRTGSPADPANIGKSLEKQRLFLDDYALTPTGAEIRDARNKIKWVDDVKKAVLETTLNGKPEKKQKSLMKEIANAALEIGSSLIPGGSLLKHTFDNQGSKFGMSFLDNFDN